MHELRERAGLPILVDGAQSVGAIPVDAGGLDYYTISGQKWLCGPDATGALVVADPERAARRPARAPSRSCATSPTARTSPRPGAERFQPNWIPLASLAGLSAALERATRRGATSGRPLRPSGCASCCRRDVESSSPEERATLVSFRPPRRGGRGRARRAARAGGRRRPRPPGARDSSARRWAGGRATTISTASSRASAHDPRRRLPVWRCPLHGRRAAARDPRLPLRRVPALGRARVDRDGRARPPISRSPGRDVVRWLRARAREHGAERGFCAALRRKPLLARSGAGPGQHLGRHAGRTVRTSRRGAHLGRTGRRLGATGHRSSPPIPRGYPADARPLEWADGG